MNPETGYCRKCQRERPVAKFRVRRAKSGSLFIDNICYSCRAKKETAILRLEMFANLGYFCACCGEDHPNFLTLEHIDGSSSKHYYGDPKKRPPHREQSNTYVELRRARASRWDKTKYEVLCINCNFAKGHYGQCPHRTGVTKESVIDSLLLASEGFGKNESIKAMIEGGKATRYKEGQERPEMRGNKFAAHLTEDQVRQIKMLRDSGKLQREVAAQFGVSRGLVGLLWSDKRWKELQVN